MRVLVFRPQPDAERSARALSDRGQKPIVAPLFVVAPGAEPPPEGPFDAVVLTSANAVPALEKAPQAWRDDLPAFCVGVRTANAARELGFATRTAKGNRADLLALIVEHLPPAQKLLLVAGHDRHEDLPEQLRAAGHEVTIWTAYEAQAVEALPEPAVEALRGGSADAALHYSPRGTQVFLALAGKAGLTAQALALPHVVLSAEVAAALISAGADTVLVAEHPEEAALFAALDQLPARILLNGDAREEAARPDAAATDGETMTAAEPASEQNPGGKRRSRSGRTPPTIELAAEPEAAATDTAAEAAAPTATEAEKTEAAAEAVLPTEALDQEFSPPPVPDQQRRFALPTVALAGLAGGVVGAGLVLLALRLAAPDDAAQLAELSKRIETLQAQSAGLPNRAALEAVERKASAAAESAAKAGSEAQANAARLAELAKTARPTAGSAGLPAGVGEKLERADSNAAAAREAAAALDRRLSEAGQRLASVESATKSALLPNRQALAAARIVLAERIRTAIAAGQPFQGDVAALGVGGLPADQLAALNVVASKGAATRDALLAQFKGHRARFASETAPASGNWQDRLVGLASRIVTIRPVGDTGANDPATLPIRLENALVQNDIAAAAALWAQLPEPARRASEAFGTALKERAAAEAAIARIAQDAVAALGAAG